MVAEQAHAYDPQCPCPACRARATREWMRGDDIWLFAWGAWQASPWNTGGGSKRLEERALLGTNAYIGKRYMSKPPLPIEYADITAAVAELDERSQACIELYYVLGVGLPTPRTFPELYPDQMERAERYLKWEADDGWGDTGVANAFARAVETRQLAPGEGGYRWVLSARRWGQIRHAAIGAIVRRVTGG